MLLTVADARCQAQRRLPRILFEYIDGGAASESTMHANEADFAKYLLEQRVLTGITTPDLRAKFLGKTHALPFMLGPVGFLGLYAGEGEMKAARAAAKAGVGFCLSCFSIASITRLAKQVPAQPMFQLYVLKDRSLALDMMGAARAAGVKTLFVTVDCAVTAIRERDVRNGFRTLTRVPPVLALKLAQRPRWCLEMLRQGKLRVEALEGRKEFGRGVLAQAAALSARIDPGLAWKDLAWVRTQWPGKIILKGIMHPQDANWAQQLGMDGIVVSNHGGRQLDGAGSTISQLADIAAAAPEIEVLVDGGFRRGADIVKALALGASGVMLGRAMAYALAAGGEAGVGAIIAHLAKEIEIALALMGCPDIATLRAEGARFVRQV
ncbi:alpha-hydroxy acid oxidase [Acidocella aminolytica]|jgi:isopentenyl diphosphate isomerase/L-lactate dehydrogenase-like FMN-dependent dehydrogenase|nr:alpha-hydroxy acid oxidase [Acidocella aminolytica]GBQ32980.1 L-lactate dehydrogenase [Acidocella aminolytica 101 = DSM 11237]SHF46935.1 FMN-dependent dehydrogenase, includes L-lactate dehydrogenase and type II isopentenyl diphosphate isomerase [Acidocella aminolytica 101 = DSM 11237]